MSAFIVSHETMSKVVASILPLRSSQLAKVFPGTDWKDIAGCLYAMNNDAIEARYGKRELSPMHDYTFSLNKSWNSYDLLKACQCLRYQCSEGKVPETELYKWLERHIVDLMQRIIEKQPEYVAASWD